MLFAGFFQGVGPPEDVTPGNTDTGFADASAAIGLTTTGALMTGFGSAATTGATGGGRLTAGGAGAGFGFGGISSR